MVAGSNAGGASHDAATAEACCNACEALRGCNVWVWCSDASSCGAQCWLKRVADPTAARAPHATGDSVPWTRCASASPSGPLPQARCVLKSECSQHPPVVGSGTLPKDKEMSAESLPPANASIAIVTLTTSFGSIRCNPGIPANL